jgi:hypothetical protein
MSSTSLDNELKYSILLKENGFKKLETFLKIAVTRAEEIFMEINPEEDSIKVNCIDPSHITNVVGILNNKEDDDFQINNLNAVLQFNVRSSDLYKILTLNADSDIMIVPDIDKKNNFDALKFVVSQNNVITKEIFVPILEATNIDLYNGTIKLITELLKSENILVIRLDVNFFIEILKESEVFNNERLRFNIQGIGKTIEKLNIETFDNETDKTRRIKTNLFEGLHFGRMKSTNENDTSEYKFQVLVSYSDLKKLVVSSKIYNSVNVILAEKSPICLLYHTEEQTNVINTLIGLLAPIIKD